MKYFMYFVVITALIGVACAHPAAEAAAAASSAASAALSHGPSHAAAASSAAAIAGDAAKKADPKDAITAMSKKVKGLNPLDFTAQITKFINKIKEACEKFLKDIFGGPSSTGKAPADQKDATPAAAAASSAASAATSNGKSDAAAASGAAAKAGHAAKKADPKDAKTAMSKNVKGVNPLDSSAQVTKFMATIKEACEKLLKDISGGSGGAGSPAHQKDASAAAAGGASVAVAVQKDAAVAASGAKSAAVAKAAEEKAADPIKAATGGEDVVAAMEAAGSKVLSDVFGSFGF